MLAAAHPWEVPTLMGGYTYYIVSQIYPLAADRLTEKLLELENPQLLELFASETDLRQQLVQILATGPEPAPLGGERHASEAASADRLAPPRQCRSARWSRVPGFGERDAGCCGARPED